MTLYLGYHRPGEPLGFAEALYASMMLIFLNPTLDFPESPWVQATFFWVPTLGVFVFTTAIVQFGFALFVKTYREEEWQKVIAGTYHDHVIVIGISRVGFRVVEELFKGGGSVVAMALPDVDQVSLIKRLQAEGIPVVTEEPRQPEGLKDAQIQHARAVILCTDDDLTNIEIALIARELNPNIRIVMRIFNDELARNLPHSLRIEAAISSSALAAPALVAAVSTQSVIHTFTFGGQVLHMAELVVHPQGLLAGKTVYEVEEKYHLSVIMRRRDSGTVEHHPAGNVQLHSGDHLVLLATMPDIHLLNRDNRRP
jgi:voltage-gated potassium channel